ncbi:MAG: CheR family methyltransferase [Myxococcaceae bacterium]
MLTIERTALDQLSALLLERAGLKIAADGYHGLTLALSARMPVVGLSDAEEYVRKLHGMAGEQELRALLPFVTVGKTDFFRDPRQFKALEETILPSRLSAARRSNRKVSIWSAGCATGEEPYSLAMLFEEQGASPLEVDMWATDLNEAAIESAKWGRYPLRRMAGVSDDRLHRFFKPFPQKDNVFEVVPRLKEFIKFQPLNLATPVFTHVGNDSVDVILCRNVIIYFDLPTIRALMDRFLQALRPGGLLLLGYSESLFKVYDKFEMIEVDGAFIYRRPLDPSAAKRRSILDPIDVPKVPAPTRPKPPEGAHRKFVPEAPPSPIRATPPRPLIPVPTTAVSVEATEGPPTRMAPPQRLEKAVAQMEKGDFAGALSAIKKLTEDDSNDLDSLITLGNIYSLMGRNAEARETFAQVLAREPLCVEARIFGGVAALQAGMLPESRSELSKALFLEPSLALGHYLLAQVQERSSDHEGARRSYRNAISQLKFTQRVLAGHYPDMPDSPDAIARAAKYALAALQEV